MEETRCLPGRRKADTWPLTQVLRHSFSLEPCQSAFLGPLGQPRNFPGRLASPQNPVTSSHAALPREDKTKQSSKAGTLEILFKKAEGPPVIEPPTEWEFWDTGLFNQL